MNRIKIFRYIIVAVALIFLPLWIFCLPKDLFKSVSYSTVVTDHSGELLGARISSDEQWRFPPCDTLPDKFKKALIEFEDRHFYSHCGVSLRALIRATMQNISSGHIVSGGSTITMQVIRLSRRQPRTFMQKIIEIFMATRLELRYTKEEILCLYASHAPFGGNVVGINAALWRYLGNISGEISWAEAATLAVLQNAPSSIHPSKNRTALLEKRNRLLRRLMSKGYISQTDYQMALEEPLVAEPHPMPQYAPHLVDWYNLNNRGEQITTAIDISLQQRIESITTQWNRELRLSGANDLAAVVIDVFTGDVIAYCGNADIEYERVGQWVDIARSPRSSGSILKPLLYAAALQEGEILPSTLLLDVPTNFGGFVPQNYNGTFAGAVPADEALALSLNVPNVHLLKQFGTARFVDLLSDLGLRTINQSTESYGLSVILGGAEVTLLDIVRLYANLSASYQGLSSQDIPLNDMVALHYMFEAMRQVNRPDQIDWQRVKSIQNIAWKTGTSYGARDAWAVGVTPRYAVGVWVGNAEGNGVANISGAYTAGPVMFDIFNQLSNSEWFESPSTDNGISLSICRHSGCIAGRDCNDTINILAPAKSIQTDACPYCHSITLSTASDNAIDMGEPIHIEKHFSLPATVEYYYKDSHPEYTPLTQITKNRAYGYANSEVISILYPNNGAILYLPQQIDGRRGKINFSISHKDHCAEIFWHLDNRFIGATQDIHQMQIDLSAGFHSLSVVDTFGNMANVEFKVI